MLPWFLRRWMGLIFPMKEEEPVDPDSFLRPPNVAFDQPMAQAIQRSPHDPAPFRAYGEWLSLQNDPRGPLILSMLEGAPADLEGFERELLGPLESQSGVEIGWRWGFWDRLSIEDPWGDRAVRLLKQVFAHPSALVLRDLTVNSSQLAEVAEVLGDGEVLLLERLVLNAEGALLGAWPAVWSRLPRLRELTMVGANVQLGGMSLPMLEQMELLGPLSDDAILDLKRANLPSLKRLVVSEPERLRGAFGEGVVSS